VSYNNHTGTSRQLWSQTLEKVQHEGGPNEVKPVTKGKRRNTSIILPIRKCFNKLVPKGMNEKKLSFGKKVAI